jgi:small subunit ribosomal protein S9
LTKLLTQTTGRRKRAVARVRLRPGNGKITINKRDLDEYFGSKTHRMIVVEPLKLTETFELYDVDVTMDGGGVSGQAGALRMGIARSLVELDPELRGVLKKAGFLARASREKESKKYGLKKARKAPQYSKR